MSLWTLLPAAPWNYPRWFPTILAALCWVFVAAVVFFFVVRVRDGFLACLIYAMILRLVLLFWAPTTISRDPLSDPVAEWRHRSGEAEQILQSLKTDREMLLERLSEADAQKGQPDLFRTQNTEKLLAAEIDELDAQIAGVEREKDRLEGVVAGMESQSRRERRKEMVSGVLSAKKREEAIRRGIGGGGGVAAPPR